MANADEQIQRLLRVREQIDDAIDSLNTRGVRGATGGAITGILLPGAHNDDEYTLLVFGRNNYLLCHQALALRGGNMAVLDWQTINPAREIGKVFGYIELPAFAVAGLVWKGASEIVRQYNFTASKNFTIRLLPTPPAGVDYCLVIRYRIGDAVYRFKLWEHIGEVLNERLYANDVIRGNFVLEIWSTPATTATNLETIQIPLSIQHLVTDFSSAPADFVDATGTVVTLAELTSPDLSIPLTFPAAGPSTTNTP